MPNAKKIAEALARDIQCQIEHDYDRIVVDEHMVGIIASIIAPHLLDAEKLAKWLVAKYRVFIRMKSGDYAERIDIDEPLSIDTLIAAIKSSRKARMKMGQNCRKCWSIIDRDDWEALDGYCGSCRRDMKSGLSDKWVCSECKSLNDENWDWCRHCGPRNRGRR